MFFYPSIHQRIHHYAVFASQSGGIADAADPRGSASWSGEIREGKEKKKLVSPLKLGVLGQATPVCHDGSYN